ncbi:atos homolog protein A isoform X1 [Onthophagus taurus]|uniref:atos homolog protein A isoform X1 n=2 Tax=Onthophagus taurus TaxID=166361 RepID=UPI0039BEA0FF
MMHSSSFDVDRDCFRDSGDVLVTVAALVTEGRIPGKVNKSKGFYEGPHCPAGKQTLPQEHRCNATDILCQQYKTVQNQILNLCMKNIPVCVEVLLVPNCNCNKQDSIDSASDNVSGEGLLLEQWHLSVNQHRPSDISSPFTFNQLINAVRSQLYFSQISAWLSSQQETEVKLTPRNFKYRLAIPGETYQISMFNTTVTKHTFPPTDLGNGFSLNITLSSLPRMSTMPNLICKRCTSNSIPKTIHQEERKKSKDDEKNGLFDDRMHTSCTLMGKHRCEDLDEFDPSVKKECKFVKRCQNHFLDEQPSTSKQQQSSYYCGKEASTSYQFRDEFKEKKKFNGAGKIEKRNCSVQEQSVKTPKLDLNEIKDALKVFDKIDLSKRQNEGGDVLLNAILRSCRLQNNEGTTLPCGKDSSTNNDTVDVVQTGKCDNMLNRCESGDIFSYKTNISMYVGSNCDNKAHNNSSNAGSNGHRCNKLREHFPRLYNGKVRQKLDFDNFPSIDKKYNDANKIIDDTNKLNGEERIVNGEKKFVEPNKIETTKKINQIVDVPSSIEQAKFRKSLDNAASMVFHSRSGLPLTSSPAPVRRGKCFDFDSSINSVSAIKSALFADNFNDEDSESDGSVVSPRSPDAHAPPRFVPATKRCKKRHSSNLLGSFEESVLNGRLEPVSTVHGFKAELGASGSFIPKHLTVPVTVFFYTLGDNDKVSSPYLGHINLGKKGYNVPPTGTLQVTLYNPSGTVVKMFVIMYDLSDMPPNTKTFIRQRTLNIPDDYKNTNDLELSPKWLRYLIHLRFMSSKSGRIYLHSDIRLVISRKTDLDTATGHGDGMHELRSFTHMPTNPKYTSIK